MEKTKAAKGTRESVDSINNIGDFKEKRESGKLLNSFKRELTVKYRRGSTKRNGTRLCLGPAEILTPAMLN